MRFLVLNGDQAPARGAAVLQVEQNLKTGIPDFTQDFGDPTSLESDLLVIASAIFAADRATARGEREDHCRNIEVRIPVVNLGRLLPLVPLLESILRMLSNDGWTIQLRQLAGSTEDTFALPTRRGRTLLFSGGIDSLAAAVELGREVDCLQLVSHRTRNSVTDGAQRRLAQMLREAAMNVAHRQYFVSSADGGPSNLVHDAENSQRTRSFVFLVLGALVARRTGNFDVVLLAENGQMAIHLPLTSARIGAFSTHTAHPAVLLKMQNLLAQALDAPITITNPYLYRTKREVTEIVLRHLPSALWETTSCWRNARLPAGTTHCGDCIPCQVRRIAIESLVPDTTLYARNLWSEHVSRLGADDDGRRNLVDLAEFVTRFRSGSNEELMSEFPELYSQAFDGALAIDMYRRFAAEATAVLQRYPNLARLVA